MSTPFSYVLIRSRRKSIALRVTDDAALEVRAPLHLPRADIDRAVASREAWITQHLAAAADRRAQKAAFALRYGGRVLLLGGGTSIIADARRPPGFAENGLFLPPDLEGDVLKAAAVQAYRDFAGRYLNDRTRYWSGVMGAVPTSVRITDAAKRWGSCSGGNRLGFAWRLVMAPPEAVDYVVVHELAHIREHNHSPRFWALVARVLPDYPARRAALTALQERLAGEDWGFTQRKSSHRDP